MSEHESETEAPDDPVLELLQGHHQQLAGLEASVDSVKDSLSEHEESITWLLKQFTADGEKKNKPVKYAWRYLEGPAREKMWETLREFVDWINARYFSRSHTRYIPGCWYRHSWAVEELTAVWAGWHAAYHNHQAPGDEAAYWHDRILWPALNRLEEDYKTCRSEKRHEEKRDMQWTTDDGFESFIR